MTFGYNLDKKTNQFFYGVFLYQNNRLIEPLVKVGIMEKNDEKSKGVSKVFGCYWEEKNIRGWAVQ